MVINLETIHIFHTNDIHSHFQFWPRMQGFLEAQRKLLASRGEASFLFDVGDFIDRSNLYTEATLGKGNVSLLNDAKYDVVTLGNNEGITLVHEEFRDLYNEATFDVIVGNLNALDQNNPSWLKPYTILTTASGTTIGVVAATAQYEQFYRDLGWKVDEPRSSIKHFAKALRAEVDILVCLSHLGITEDELLAAECPEIDVIFGAHTHHVFEHGKVVNGVLLTGGGKFGQYIGHLTFVFDHKHNKLIKKEDALIELALLPAVPNEHEFIHHLHVQAKDILKKPLFQTYKTYTKEWFHYSPLSNLFADMMIEHTEADIALFNAGIFMKPLEKGYVTAADLHEMLPHPINLCTVEIKGSELKEIYMQAQNEDWPNIQLKGLGFRGIVVGKLLTYNFHMDKHRELFVGGERADLNKTYKLVTLDLFTFGFFFPSFKYMKKQYYLPDFLRDIFKNYMIRQL